MRGNRSRDTGPELALRRALHRLGLRFWVQRRLPPVKTSADIVFPRLRLAVFVDGCFWHGCSEHYRPARSNADYWAIKIARNAWRDRRNDALLRAAGWTVVRVWEHEPVEVAASRVRSEVNRLRAVTEVAIAPLS
jgi:DNA mismatch endonuclease (patch repair protein)